MMFASGIFNLEFCIFFLLVDECLWMERQFCILFFNILEIINTFKVIFIYRSTFVLFWINVPWQKMCLYDSLRSLLILPQLL